MIFKIHTALSANCVKDNLSEPYFIWLLAKNISNNGSGWVNIKDLEIEYINIFECSTKTFYNHLRKNNFNIFYSLNDNHCYLNSFKNIVKQFNPIIVANSCFEVEVETIKNNFLKPKQILINCVLGSDKKHKPLSLWYIAEVLNLDKSTITRNIDKSLIKTITNSRADKSDLRKFWSSYIFIGGNRLPAHKEKPEIKLITSKPKSEIKLKKLKNGWEILGRKIK